MRLPKNNIKRLALGALFGSVSLVLTGTMGCTTSRQAPRADAAPMSELEQKKICRSILHTLETVKRIWAMENRQRDSVVPTDADLFGPGAYLREKPKCPSGGTYTLGAVGDHPVCSIPEHVY